MSRKDRTSTPYVRLSHGFSNGSPSNGLAIDPDMNDDPFYRYRTVPLSISHRGKDRMKKTEFDNLERVSADLQVPSSWMIGYIGYALSAKWCAPDTVKNEKAYVAGHFDTDLLEDKLFEFIKKFVLCPQCSLPELRWSVAGKKKKCTVKYCCSSCGAHGNANSGGSTVADEKFQKLLQRTTMH